MLKIFTIKFENNLESFNDSILSNFLSDKGVVRWESRFFEHKKEYYWTIVVEYNHAAPSSAVSAGKHFSPGYLFNFPGTQWSLAADEKRLLKGAEVYHASVDFGGQFFDFFPGKPCCFNNDI